MMSILSQDLVEEILSRVPATYLKRLRYTCKQWNALFNDHRFTKKHFDKAPKEFKVIMLANFRVYLLSVDLRGIRNSIDPSIEVKGGVIGLLGDKNSKIFHCNGLFLCTKGTKECDGRIVVYNPCTGKTRWIELRTVYKYFDKFTLGYKNNKSCCESYKILRLCRRYTSSFVADNKFEIYEFNSNSWRVLDDIPYDQTHFETNDRGAVSLKGNTYWIASDEYDKQPFLCFLLQFDFTKERFRRFLLPFECNYNSDSVELTTVREEKLAVLFQKFGRSTMEVWLTNKIDDELDDVSWRMLFKVDLDETYRDAPPSMMMIFIVDEEKEVAMFFESCHKCIELGGNADTHCPRTYIIGQNKITEVNLGKSAVQSILWNKDPFLFSYVPSLIQIQEPQKQ